MNYLQKPIIDRLGEAFDSPAKVSLTTVSLIVRVSNATGCVKNPLVIL